MMALLLSFCIAVFLLPNNIVAGAELVGLRLLFNLGFPEEGSYCSSHELHALRLHVNDAVLGTLGDESKGGSSDNGTRRQLDDGTSYWCTIL